MTRTQGLWLCLLLLVLLLFFCVRHHAPVIESDLAERSRAVLDAGSMTWANIDLDGRDVTLTGAAPSAELRAKAGALASAVWGVRNVDNQLSVDSTTAAPAAAPDPASIAPAEPATTADEPVVAAEPDLQVEQPTAADESLGPGVDTAVAETESSIEAAADTASVESAALNCQQEFNRLLEGKTSVLFESSRSAIKLTGLELLQEIAVVARSCPGVDIEISGHTDASGTDALNQRLSQSRADAVKDALTELGMDASAMTAVGYGSAKAIADNASPAGRAQNRRVELIVKGL